MLEFYQAYANYKDLIVLTQELIAFVAKEVNGTTITRFGGVEIDLARWETLTMREAIIKWWPEEAEPKPNIGEFVTPDSFRSFIAGLQRHYSSLLADYASKSNALIESICARPGNQNLTAPAALQSGTAEEQAEYLRLSGQAKDADWKSRLLEGELRNLTGKAVATVFELLAEPHLIQPTIIYEFPLAVSPLSKQKPDEPDWVERFEFYIGGFELGNAFSELNDPEEQFRRFKEQLEQHERGDEEAHQMDLDYVRALAYGLPPTAGEGIGIDRLTMILTGAKSIRDVILFPLLKPQGGSAEEK
jgi:lysyl-tRNA synthetase class 2